MSLTTWMGGAVVALGLATSGCGPSDLMTAPDLFSLDRPPPDAIIAYGSDSLQVGELYLPATAGNGAVVVLIHGGCWVAQYRSDHVRSLAKAIAGGGVTVWSLEYRRLGNPGGGWPGTFTDVALGVDYLRQLAARYPIDTNRVLLAGHSAGGHLALWAASRPRLPPEAPASAGSLRPKVVVSLAGIPDLEQALNQGVCGDVVLGLLDGTPTAQPDRYQWGSPARYLPLGVRQIIVTGAGDVIVPPLISRQYAERAALAGDQVTREVIPDAGHFELVAPLTSGGRRVVELIVAAALAL